MYSKTKLFLLCLSVFFLAGGCLNFKQPRTRVHHYILEYASPEIADLEPLPVSLKVERFSVAPAYNTNRMIFRDASFKRDEYFYHKWRANPGDMVTDFFVVEGSVDEFVEWDSPEGWNAALAITIALIAAEEPDVTKRILFQKTYRMEKPFTEKNPQGLAQAMSLAMADISMNIMRDIYAALKD